MPLPSQSRQRNRYTAPITIAAAIVFCAFAFSPNFRLADDAHATPYAGDFLQEWLGGYIVRAGDHARFYDPAYAQALQHDAGLVGFRFDESRYLPIVYPPFYYLIVAPLSLLPVRGAAFVWAGLMVAALAASLWLLFLAVRHSTGFFAERDNASTIDRERSQRRWQLSAPWLIPIGVVFMPLIESLTSSQKGTLCLLILTATFLLLNARRPLTAGMVFGLLAFKPQLVLVIAPAMLFKRQWRFVGGGALAGIVLVALSLAVGGDVCRQYFAFATGAADYIRTSGYDLHKSHCLYGFFTLLAGESNIYVKGATLIALLGVVALLVALLRGPLEPGSRKFGLQFSGLVVATLLVSPHLFTYDLTMLLLPMFLLGYALIHQSPQRRRGLRLQSALLLGLFALAGLSPGIAAQTGLQITVPLMVGLLAALATCNPGICETSGNQ